MPLNPNGKVDKPALPFPDIAQLNAASGQRRRRRTSALEPMNAYDSEWSATARTLRDIWKSLLPMHTEQIQLKDNFFDIGGHSILATRMIFEVRNKFVANVPLGLVFKKPTLEGLSEEIAQMGRGNEIRFNNLKDGATTPVSRDKSTSPTNSDYAQDAKGLAAKLPSHFETASELVFNKDHSVFLTGATGFLGAFLVRELLSTRAPNVKVYAHVRADTTGKGFSRIKKSCEAYGVWEEDWESRVYSSYW